MAKRKYKIDPPIPECRVITDEDQFVALFNALSRSAERTNINNGFNNAKTHNLILHAMIHEEIGEATKAWRKNAVDDKLPQFTGEEVELGDAVIRIMTMAAAKNLRVAEAIVAKMEYNKTREYRHGGKKV